MRTNSVSHVNHYKVSYHDLLKGKARKIGGDDYFVSCRHVGGLLGTSDYEDDKIFTFLTDSLLKIRRVDIQYNGKRYDIVKYQTVRKILFSYRQQ